MRNSIVAKGVKNVVLPVEQVVTEYVPVKVTKTVNTQVAMETMVFDTFNLIPGKAVMVVNKKDAYSSAEVFHGVIKSVSPSVVVVVFVKDGYVQQQHISVNDAYAGKADIICMKPIRPIQ